MAKKKTQWQKAPEAGVQHCSDGKYRWVYEVDMLRNPYIFYDVVGVLALSFGIVGLFVTLLNGCENGFSLETLWSFLLGFGILFAFMCVLGIIAYLIVALVNGRKYNALFEMDEEGIVHTQIKRKVKHATIMMWMGVFAGIIAGRPGQIPSSIRAATATSLSSTFTRVRKVKAVPRHNLIKVNGLLTHNRVYVRSEDYQMVYDYICQHCINAKIS